jgi:hypothetical protein
MQITRNRVLTTNRIKNQALSHVLQVQRTIPLGCNATFKTHVLSIFIKGKTKGLVPHITTRFTPSHASARDVIHELSRYVRRSVIGSVLNAVKGRCELMGVLSMRIRPTDTAGLDLQRDAPATRTPDISILSDLMKPSAGNVGFSTCYTF